jgi:RNA polymerase sigma-70 factor (ECF subfamily)
MTEADLAPLLTAALGGDRPQVRALVTALHPIVRGRVWRALQRSGRAHRRDPTHELEDIVQEIFGALFAGGAKVLRAWDPARGLSLGGFVGIVAERYAISLMRSGRRNPWADEPIDVDSSFDEAASDAADAEAVVSSREELADLLERLRERLSPLGMHLFNLLYVEERPVADVVATAGLSEDAVYAWRSRLRKLAVGLQAEATRSGPAATDRSKRAQVTT